MIEVAFQEAFRGYGIPHRVPDRDYVRSGSLQIVLKFLRFALSIQRKGVGPKGPIYFDIIENPEFNAVGTYHDGYELITIFLGAIDYIFKLYFCFLSDPNTLPTIGNAAAELMPSEALAILNKRGRYIPNIYLPKDEQRVEAARALSFLTCSFMLLHEAGHIIRCHPRYLQIKYGIPAYEEIPAPEAIRLHDWNMRFAFEWEADEYAAGTTYQFWQHIRDREMFRALNLVDPDLIWATSVAMMFLTIAHFSDGDLVSRSLTHPAPMVRFIWCAMSVDSAPSCKKYNPTFDSFSHGLREVMSWFSRNNLPMYMETDEDFGGFAERMKADHKLVHDSLQSEFTLLEQLNEERIASAKAWLLKNNLGNHGIFGV